MNGGWGGIISRVGTEVVSEEGEEKSRNGGEVMTGGGDNQGLRVRLKQGGGNQGKDWRGGNTVQYNRK